MTIEIVEFRCPYCGYLLGEEEAKNAYIKKQKEIDEKVELKLHEQVKQLQIEHSRKIQKINEQYQLDREKEITIIVNKRLNEEKTLMELKYSKELAQKDRLIEATKLENVNRIDEKISEAIAINEQKYRQRETERDLHNSRIEADNKNLMNQVEKLQKTLENIPPELRGTASEFVLLDELHKAFPNDDISPKKVGVPMADVVQIIIETGQQIPVPIVYDRKTGENITKLDIAKAKNYKTIHKTDYSIIVSEKGIRDNLLTEEREGVLLVHPRIVVDIAKRIRCFLIEISKQTQSNKGRHSKQSKLYEYFTSAEYYRDVKVAFEAKVKLDELQRKEIEYHRTLWNRQKEYVGMWFEIDKKNERLIFDITQEDQNTDEDPTESKKDGDYPS